MTGRRSSSSAGRPTLSSVAWMRYGEETSPLLMSVGGDITPRARHGVAASLRIHGLDSSYRGPNRTELRSAVVDGSWAVSRPAPHRHPGPVERSRDRGVEGSASPAAPAGWADLPAVRPGRRRRGLRARHPPSAVGGRGCHPVDHRDRAARRAAARRQPHRRRYGDDRSGGRGGPLAAQDRSQRDRRPRDRPGARLAAAARRDITVVSPSGRRVVETEWTGEDDPYVLDSL